MKLRNVAALYVSRVREQLGQELLALVGIGVGVSLLFAALGANSSLTGSFERVTHGIAGAARFQLAGRGEGFDARRLLAVQRLPSVADAAAILEVRSEIRTPVGRESVLLIGVAPDFAKLGGTLTRGFSYAWLANVQALALPTPLVDKLGISLGEPVTLNVDGRNVQARLGAKLQGSDIGSLVGSPIAIAPLRYAQTLSGRPGIISRVFVRPRAGQEAATERALRRLAAGRADVRPADFDAVLFRQAAEPTSQSTTMFSVFSAMVGFLFAFSAVLLTVPKRRLLIADLLIEGFGPRAAAKVLLFDALVLGVLATGLGVVVGDQLARQLFDQRPAFLDMAFTFGTERIITLSTVGVAVAGGIVASLFAVLGPMAPGLLRGDEEPKDLERPGVGIGTVALGLGFLAAGAAIVVAKPDSAGVGIGGLVCLTAAMLLLLPAMLHLLAGLLDLATRGTRSIVPFLAVSDLRDPATHLRSLAVAATGAVAVFASVALQGSHADLQRGLDRTAHDLASIGDLWAVAPGSANLLVTTPFARPAVSRPPGILTLADYRGSFLDIADRRIWVFGSPAAARRPFPRGQMIEGNTALATRRLREGGWAVVSAALAGELGLHVGERFVLPSPVPVALRVTALSTNMGWPPGAIVLNARDYARAWGSADVSAMTATLAPGTTPTEGRRLLRAALGSSSGLVVKTAAERERALDAGSRQGLSRLTQIAELVLASATIAMAAAMAGMILQRRAFLASINLVGYSTGALWRSLLVEAAVLVGAGCAIGAAFGLLGQSLLSRALTSVTGFPVAYSIATTDAIVSCALVTVIAVAIIGVFGHRAARVDAQSELR